MNLGLRKEEAMYIKDLIIQDIVEYGEVDPDLDIEGIIKQLDLIIILGDSVEEEKRIQQILNRSGE